MCTRSEGGLTGEGLGFPRDQLWSVWWAGSKLQWVGLGMRWDGMNWDDSLWRAGSRNHVCHGGIMAQIIAWMRARSSYAA